MSLTEKPIVDLESALARFDGDMDFLKSMFVKFMKYVPEQMKALNEALSAGDAEEVQRHAHSIKGSAGSLSATIITALARNLEEMGERRELSGAMPVVEELNTEISRLKKFVEGL